MRTYVMCHLIPQDPFPGDVKAMSIPDSQYQPYWTAFTIGDDISLIMGPSYNIKHFNYIVNWVGYKKSYNGRWEAMYQCDIFDSASGYLYMPNGTLTYAKLLDRPWMIIP